MVIITFALFRADQTHAQSSSNTTFQILGKGDTVGLRVVYWREQEREFRLLDAVNGTYTIQPDGNVMIALAGSFVAAGMKTNELSEMIAAALQQRLGSIESPSVVVEVVEFSQFYIIGDVERPGAFEATPGLTAQQAFALAGGAQRFRSGGLDDVTTGMRDTGNLSQVLLDLLRAKVASVRLRAESQGLDELVFEADFEHPDGPDVMATLVEEERKIFAERKTALAREQTSLSELIALLKAEVTALETKTAGLATQLAFSEKNLSNIQSLVERGLARGPQLSLAQSGLFDLESKALDLQNGIYRAQQSIKEAERDQVSLFSNRATTAALELQNTNAKIEALHLRSEVLKSIILERGAEAGASNSAVGAIVTTFDIQRGNGASRENLTGPDTILMSGDIVKVAQILVPEIIQPTD
jgi:protein involved in polysaccharide export with SLBB domain